MTMIVANAMNITSMRIPYAVHHQVNSFAGHSISVDRQFMARSVAHARQEYRGNPVPYCVEGR